MNLDMTEIAEVVIMIVSAVISTLLVPYLRQRLSDEKREKLLFWIKTAVRAAEQIYGSKTGQQKKEYVVGFLLSKGIVVDIDEVTALIESEVYKLTDEKVSKAEV